MPHHRELLVEPSLGSLEFLIGLRQQRYTVVQALNLVIFDPYFGGQFLLHLSFQLSLDLHVPQGLRLHVLAVVAKCPLPFRLNFHVILLNVLNTRLKGIPRVLVFLCGAVDLAPCILIRHVVLLLYELSLHGGHTISVAICVHSHASMHALLQVADLLYVHSVSLRLLLAISLAEEHGHGVFPGLLDVCYLHRGGLGQ